jgi:ABC-type multidrug transport system permease subunit
MKTLCQVTLNEIINRTCFCIASFISAIGIITERVSGSWNRLQAAGVKPYFFLMPHLVEDSAIMMIQFIEFSLYVVFFLLTKRTLSSVALVTGLILMSSFTGLVFGLLFSVIMKSPMESLMFTQFIVYPVTFISGELTDLTSLSSLSYFNLCVDLRYRLAHPSHANLHAAHRIRSSIRKARRCI